MPVFADFSLRIDAHPWVSIIGPEGSGKTTLAKLIKGLYRPASGTINVHVDSPDGTAFVGFLGGDPWDSLVGTSVEEDVAFGLENLRLPCAEIQARVQRALQWTGLAGMEQRLTHTLSGGEQQKLALAAMLALDARVLILDEALSMLDRPTRGSIRVLMRELRRDSDLTVIEITHNLDEALEAERLIFLSKEGIGFDGAPEVFLLSPLGSHWARMAGGLVALREAMSRQGIVAAPSVARWHAAQNLYNNIKIKEG